MTVPKAMPATKGNKSAKREFAPALLQVSKQVRTEAAAMYYGLNDVTIIIEDMHFCKFYSWLTILGPLSKELRSITFIMEGDGGWPDWAGYAKLEEKHLSRACLVNAVGNFQMATAFDEAMKTVKHLRSCGLKWVQIKIAMDHMSEMVGAVSVAHPKEYEWAEMGNEEMMHGYGLPDMDELPCPGKGESDLDIDHD